MTRRAFLALACTLSVAPALAQTAPNYGYSSLLPDLPLSVTPLGGKEIEAADLTITALTVVGGVQVGQNTASCVETMAGQIRWNATIIAFEGCNGTSWQPLGGSEPTGQVAYFQLANCPSGWEPADGTNSTVALRGEFIRGWDNGRGVDPGRILASWQAATAIANMPYEDDSLQYNNADSDGQNPFGNPFDGFNCCHATAWYFTVRPRNVALLACIKT